ncbi:MAG: hypothetical protein PHZ02_03155 [Desulfocapsaceae bacterium]|nr:hypothetical protein [Desulfocapsaceae bacterium]
MCTWISSGAQAADKVVIIPMGGAKTLQNVVTVAKANGKFTDPVAAISSITDASATNPYLILIAPGQYTLTKALVMKPYVDISGSGESVTLLTGSISSLSSNEYSAIVKAANNATLSNLSISNIGSNKYSFGIYTTGLDNTARIKDVSVTASGGTEYNWGVYNNSSSPSMTHMCATALGVTGTNNWGIYNYFHSSPTLTEVNAIASGGANSFGIYNYNYSSPTMTEVSATASAGTNNNGVRNYNSTQVTIRRSTLSVDSGFGIYNSTSSASITQSTIIGSVAGTGFWCVASDNGSGTSLNGSCL